MPSFPFNHLPAELRLEIIRFAAVPAQQFHNNPPPFCYATTVALCTVSHSVRQAAMPHLLHTVVLTTSASVWSFIDSVKQQQYFRQTDSRLTLDYCRLVRRFWSTSAWEPMANSGVEEYLNYGALYEIIRNVESFGVHVRSQHLLYRGLSSPSSRPDEDWRCRRLTFAGSYWRWSPMTSTPDGLACLRRVTHLVLWIHDVFKVDTDDPIPTWLKNIPFNSMPALTHMAFAITTTTTTAADSSQSLPDPETCRRWIVNQNPSYEGIVNHMVIRPMQIEPTEGVWELAFLQGKNEDIWSEER